MMNYCEPYANIREHRKQGDKGRDFAQFGTLSFEQWHYTFYFLFLFLKSAPNLKQLYHQFITYKIKYETTFSKNGYGHSS
jgi:hypothetical protein